MAWGKTTKQRRAAAWRKRSQWLYLAGCPVELRQYLRNPYPRRLTVRERMWVEVKVAELRSRLGS